MVTKEQAVSARYRQEFHTHRGGKVSKVRVSGQCQTWKTRPAEFRLPVKFGLYQSLEINERNAAEWFPGGTCTCEPK